LVVSGHIIPAVRPDRPESFQFFNSPGVENRLRGLADQHVWN